MRYSKISESLYIKGRIGWKGLKKKEYLQEGSYRIINASNIVDNKIDWSNCGYISKERYDESEEIKLKEGDILITKDGTIGKVAMVNKLDKPSTVASGLFILRNINLKKWDTLYLFYYLQSFKFKEFIYSRTSGSVIPHLYQRDFEELMIPELSLKQQKQISQKIHSIQQKIDLNNKINTNLLELGLELISNINFENYQSLNKIVEVKDGTHSSPASTLNGYPLVTSKAIKGTSVDFSQTKNISEADFTEINKRSLVEYHDILISMIGTVGIVHLVTENPVKYAIKNVGLIKSSDKKLLSPFLYLYLLSYYGQTYIRKHLSGSTQQFISLTNLRKMPIPISSDIPAKLIEKLNTIVLQIEHNSNENNTLNSIKNVLLEKYF